jgi:hypothetical protein
MNGLSIVIDNAIDKIYADFPGSKTIITGDRKISKPHSSTA